MKAFISNQTEIIKETEKAVLIELPYTPVGKQDGVRFIETWVPKSCIIDKIPHSSNKTFHFKIKSNTLKTIQAPMMGVWSSGEYEPLTHD